MGKIIVRYPSPILVLNSTICFIQIISPPLKNIVKNYVRFSSFAIKIVV